MIKRVVLSPQAQADLKKLDRAIALTIVKTIHRFAFTGAGASRLCTEYTRRSSDCEPATGA